MDLNTGKIILDNGGGITLQLGGFAHFYDDAKYATRDLAAWLADPNTSDWEGHEDDAAGLDPTDDQIRNGGYRWVRLDRNTDTVASLATEIRRDAGSWGNGEEMVDYLDAMIAAA